MRHQAKPDSIATHLERWRYLRDGRGYWSRQARIDLRYLAGKTWTDEEGLIFESEGRQPSNYNLILPKMQLVCGIEAQTRQDLKILPRAERDVAAGEALTKIVKFVSDQTHLGRQMSRAFWQAAGLGIGWLEVGYSEDVRREQISVGTPSPFDLWVDPACREPDLADAQDVIRAKWVRADSLALRFPAYAEEIRGMVGRAEDRELSHTHDYTERHGDRAPVRTWQADEDIYDLDWGGVDTTRDMVRGVERWYRCECRRTFVRLLDGRVEAVDESNALPLARLILAKEASPPIVAVDRQVRVAVFAGDVLLQDSSSPYPHGEFPFVPIWGYQDEEGRPMGLIRQDRDPQKEFNSRRTSALKKSLMRQLWHETGAFRDVAKAIEAVGQHDGVIELTPGALTANRAHVRADTDTLPAEIQAMEQARLMIQDWSGSTKELAGQESNATSGIAIQARQTQGQTALFTLFDARDAALQRVGEQLLALIQETYSQARAVRITESPKGLGWVRINSRQPDGTILNDITQGRYDVIVAGQPHAAADRTQQLEALSNFLSGMPPEIRMAFAPEMADLADLPNADEVRAKIEALTERFMALSMGGGGPTGAPPPGLPPEAGPPAPANLIAFPGGAA